MSNIEEETETMYERVRIKKDKLTLNCVIIITLQWAFEVLWLCGCCRLLQVECGYFAVNE